MMKYYKIVETTIDEVTPEDVTKLIKIAPDMITLVGVEDVIGDIVDLEVLVKNALNRDNLNINMANMRFEQAVLAIGRTWQSVTPPTHESIAEILNKIQLRTPQGLMWNGPNVRQKMTLLGMTNKSIIEGNKNSQLETIMMSKIVVEDTERINDVINEIFVPKQKVTNRDIFKVGYDESAFEDDDV